MSDIPPPEVPPGGQRPSMPPPTGPTAPPPPPPGGLIPPPPAWPQDNPYGTQYGNQYGMPPGGPYGSPVVAPPSRVRGLGRWIGVLLIATAVVQAIGILLTWSIRDDADALAAGRIDDDEFVSRYAPSALVTMIGSVVTISLVVLTMIWMFRLAKNQRALGRNGTWGPGWAIGGWFAPPVLFVIPWLMLRELWRGSDPAIAPGDPRWAQAPVAPVVQVWWVLYGIVPLVLLPLGVSTTFGNVGSSDAADLAEQIRDSAPLTTLSGIASIAAAAAFYILVRQLTGRHTTLTGEA